MSTREKKHSPSYKAARALQKKQHKEQHKEQREEQRKENDLQAERQQRLDEHQAEEMLHAAAAAAELNPARKTLLRRLTKQGLNPNTPAAAVRDTGSFGEKFLVKLQSIHSAAAGKPSNPANAKVAEVIAKAGDGSSKFERKVQKAISKAKAFFGLRG